MRTKTGFSAGAGCFFLFALCFFGSGPAWAAAGVGAAVGLFFS